MSDNTFSTTEGFNVINEMIRKTREDLSANSFYFLLWGWAVFVACISQYILKHVFEYRHHYIVWNLMIICAVITFYVARKERSHEKVRTYVGESMGYLWTGLFISFIVLSLIFMKIGWINCYPFFMLLYGLGTFVSGKLLAFKPFAVGGLLSFALAAISVWFHYDYYPLFGAAAILVSYIIPGHMIMKRKQNYE